MNIAEILQLKFPEIDLTKQVILRDDGDGPYIDKWDTGLGPKPDQAQLDAWALEVVPIKQELDARQNRRQEYPAIGDQLDALLKQFDDMEANGLTLNPEFKNIKDNWKAVKAKYPIQGK